MKKAAVILNKGIHIIFLILTAGILVSTLLIDRYIDNPFPNTVRYANGGYYFFAALLVILLSKYVMKCDLRKEKVFYFLLAGMAVLGFVIQILITCWFPVEIGADFTVCKNTAIELAGGGTLAGVQYYQRYPNNVNITMIFAFIYSIFSSWRAVMLVGALLTNLSVLLAALSVYNCVRSKMACLITEIVGLVLAAFTWRAFIPYTDNFGMIFVAVIVWAYTSRLNKNYKAAIILAAGVLGGRYIKATVLIPLFAVAGHLFIQYLTSGVRKIPWKKIGICVISICIVFGCAKLIEKVVHSHSGYIPGEAAVGWQYFFMLGQNTQYYGTYNGADEAYASGIADYEERGQKCLAEGIKRVKDRKLIGNIKYYMKKLNVAYNDGYFNNVQWDPECRDNFLAELYLRGGAYYDWGADVLQVLWDFILLLTALGGILKIREKSAVMFQILIIGITLYILVFENRSKYLYMFLPVYIAYAGIVYYELLNFMIQAEHVLRMDLVEKS